MTQRAQRAIEVLAVVAAAFVLVAAIAQAVHEKSWTPIWMVGWIPAVLVAARGDRRSRGSCLERLRRRRHA